ncbi:hypothetical protein DXG03_008687 [Asterophora parasitica]|uniref:Uncharacterized protein n=1 Tax=Asterophora parasitica TaxID=117018 RepID=A0A9P7G8W3_9AGAR|nr:hypothetical protein DXG03_008687 [Asterophora parasitica]
MLNPPDVDEAFLISQLPYSGSNIQFLSEECFDDILYELSDISLVYNAMDTPRLSIETILSICRILSSATIAQFSGSVRDPDPRILPLNFLADLSAKLAAPANDLKNGFVGPPQSGRMKIKWLGCEDAALVPTAVEEANDRSIYESTTDEPLTLPLLAPPVVSRAWKPEAALFRSGCTACHRPRTSTTSSTPMCYGPQTAKATTSPAQAISPDPIFRQHDVNALLAEHPVPSSSGLTVRTTVSSSRTRLAQKSKTSSMKSDENTPVLPQMTTRRNKQLSARQQSHATNQRTVALPSSSMSVSRSTLAANKL